VLVKIKKLPNLKELPLPQYNKDGDSARDMRAAIDTEIVLEPGDVAKVPTGVALDLGIGVEAQVRPRSGLSSKGILVHWGTVDSSFTGELCVIIHNLSKTPLTIQRGDRIAQLVIAEVVHYEWQEVEELRETSRGTSGFGSSGIK
jgi:dUTP pyrophosphatase